jgi:hypothetical protein
MPCQWKPPPHHQIEILVAGLFVLGKQCNEINQRGKRHLDKFRLGIREKWIKEALEVGTTKVGESLGNVMEFIGPYVHRRNHPERIPWDYSR